MKTKITASIAVTVISVMAVFGSAAVADDKDVVQVFYDFLSNPTSEQHATALESATSENWESIGDYSGQNKTLDSFLVQIGGFGKLIPDMNWAVEEIIQAGNTTVVRSRATGTPNGPLFGVDGQGKSFDILTIDIHTIENEKIIRTFHVEDWAGALRQLSTQ